MHNDFAMTLRISEWPVYIIGLTAVTGQLSPPLDPAGGHGAGVGFLTGGNEHLPIS